MRIELRCSCGASFSGIGNDAFERSDIVKAATVFTEEHRTHTTADDGSAAVAALVQDRAFTPSPQG